MDLLDEKDWLIDQKTGSNHLYSNLDRLFLPENTANISSFFTLTVQLALAFLQESFDLSSTLSVVCQLPP